MPAKSRRNLTLPPGENGARARTHRRLLASAMQLVRRGRTPSVAEVALTAGVSRAEDAQKGGDAEGGYLPGNRSAVGLGLSPYAPRAPGMPGGVTTPFAAPDPKDEWKFNFWGYMSAALRVSIEQVAVVPRRFVAIVGDEVIPLGRLGRRQQPAARDPYPHRLHR